MSFPNIGYHAVVDDQHGKTPAPKRDSEEAPLLDGAGDDENETHDNDSKNKRTSTWLQISWHWFQRNRAIVALILLLLGGLVALIVYFAGML